MTAAAVEQRFEREYGCSVVEWERWLPGAVRDCPLLRPADNCAEVAFGPSAQLVLKWTVLAPRHIALITLPRLLVRFNFSDHSGPQRASFMRYFDLYMQRGGG